MDLREVEEGTFAQAARFTRFFRNLKIKLNFIKDAVKINDTQIFKMATSAPMGVFDRVLLVSATGDRYVSLHSGNF